MKNVIENILSVLLILVAGLGLYLLMVTVMSLPAFGKERSAMVDQMFEPSFQLGEFCSGEMIHSDRH